MGKRFADPDLPPIKKWSKQSKVIIGLVAVTSLLATLLVILK